MADENDNQVDEAQAEVEGSPPQSEARSGSLLWIILSMGVVVGAAGAGFVLARLMNRPQSADAAQAAQTEPEPPPPPMHEDYKYYELDPITVNLDGPRLERYIRAKITLAMRPENHTEATALIEKKKPELISWLNAYLAGCSLEEVRGTSNQNRLMREIKDSFNERLWPERNPRIEQVLFAEFAVQ